MPYTSTPSAFTWENLADSWASLFSDWVGNYKLVEKVELALSRAFTLDDPITGVIGSEFVIAGIEFVDITDRVQGVSIQRGKNRDLDRFNAGTLTVNMKNFDRAFDPLYDLSPFAGNIVPRRDVRVTIDGAPVYLGKVEDWNLDFQPAGVSYASLTASDALSFLALQELTPGTAIVESSGDRVTTVLSQPSVDWPLGLRDIDTGASTLGADTFEGNVLQYLQKVELSEQGLLFIGKDGKLIFRDRLATPAIDNVTVFDAAGTGIPFLNVTVDYGTELLYNQITATSEAGTAIANDALSQTRYGIIAQSFDTLLDGASQLQDYADFIANRYSEPELRFSSIQINFRALTTGQAIEVLSLDMGDVVQVNFTPSNVGSPVSRYGLVIGISHEITVDEHYVTLSLGSLQTSLFVIGDAEFGSIGVDAPGVLGF